MKAGIAGAGLLGRLLALRLVNAGWSVTLFDDNPDVDANSCSRVAAGLLTPLTELEKNASLIFTLGSVALTHYWPAILSLLDKPIYFQTAGSLVLAHPRDHAELDRFVEIIRTKLPRSSDNYYRQPDAYYHQVSATEISTLEPELTKWDKGFYFPAEGNIDNQTLLRELGNFLLQQDVQWHHAARVEHIQPGEIITANQRQPFDWVFDCRGLGARSHFPELRGVRGELVWLHAPHVRIQRPVRLLNPRYSLYIAPRPDDIYIIGASEIESEDQGAISVRTLFELLSSASYVHSGFHEARVIKTLTHVRPTLPDNLPKLKYADHFIAANGLYRHGFLIAPALVEEIFSYVQEGSGACCYPSLWEPFDANFFK